MNGNDPSFDYDYPVPEKKPVQNIPPELPWSSTKQQQQQPSRAVSTSSLFSRLPPSSNNNNKKSTVKNQNNEIRSSNNSTKIGAGGSLLDFVIPLSDNGDSNGGSRPQFKIIGSGGGYYDIPRNVPTTTSKLPLRKFPISSSSNNLCHQPPTDRPVLPQKSSFVKNKISSYKMPLYQNLKKSNSDGDDSKKENGSGGWYSLPRNSRTSASCQSNIATTKTLPPPLKPKPVPKPVIPEKSSSSSSVPASIRSHQDVDDDDDDDDCDYDYNYVCLEPKRKLDADDEKIKLLLGQCKESLQLRYENLVLRSDDNLPIEQLERRLAGLGGNSFSPPPSNGKVAVVSNQSAYHYYRSIIVKAVDNFQCWTRFSVDIIRRQYKPEIYFNFVKHILLSGQYLLSVFKLAQRHSATLPVSGSNNNSILIRNFGENFLNILRQIVTKTRRACALLTTESFTELIECIRDAAIMASRVPEIIFGFKA